MNRICLYLRNMGSAAATVGPMVSINGYANQMKSVDANRYATKKTIAQGMLDIALLTANASQLKYILQVGKAHELYTLMLVLITLSIGLQILSGLLSLSLNLMLDRKMEDSRNQLAVEWAVVGILFIIIGGLNINKTQDHWAANIINDIILIAVFVITLINIVISGFGMEFNNKPLELTGYRRHVNELESLSE